MKKRKTEAYVFQFWLTDLENLERSIKENTDSRNYFSFVLRNAHS
jgi:hypothetical protein